MNLDNFINIPVTTPIVRDPNNTFELFAKGFYSTNTKFYVVNQIEASVIHVETRYFDYHLKGFAKLIFVATIIGPLFCLIIVGICASQRKFYRFKVIKENHVLQRMPPLRIVRQIPQEPDLMPIVKASIEKSTSSLIPLAPKFYLTNIAKALQIYLEADPTLANFKSVDALIREKEMIVSQIIDSLKVPESRKNDMTVLLHREFDREFALLRNPHLKIKLCICVVNAITSGGDWVAKMDKAFCGLIEMLPDKLEEMKKEKEFIELQGAVENLARHAEQRVLENLELTKFRDVYNPVAIRLGLPEMELKNFTENDETLAKELQVLENMNG